jgi:hypothetical protein
MSIRQIAAATGLPKSTVSDTVRQLSNSGQLEQPERITGADGKSYAATRPAPAPAQAPGARSWPPSTAPADPGLPCPLRLRSRAEHSVMAASPEDRGPVMSHTAADLTPTAPARPRRWRLWVGLGVAVAAVIGGTVAELSTHRTPGPLAADPAGASACANLAQWIKGDLDDPATGKPYNGVLVSEVLAGYAKDATTPGIKATASELMTGDVGNLLKANGGPSSLQLANLPKLHAACVAAGVHMPAYAEPGN